MIHFCILPLCSDSSLHNKTLTLLICIVQSSVWCDIIWLPLPQIVQHTTKLSQTLTLLKCITQSSAWCDIIWLPPPPQASRATSRDRSIPQIWGQNTFSRHLWMSSFGIGCQRFGGTVFPPLTAMFVRNSGRVPGDLLLQTKVFRGKSTTGALRVF